MGIRRARLADLDAVVAIENSWKTTPHWTLKQFRAEIDNPGSLFLVSEDGQDLSGYGVMWIVPPEAQLLNIAVAQDRARQGLAGTLLHAMTIMARGWGCLAVTLEVSARNHPAQALYKRSGFRVVGRRAKFYNDGSDALLMDLVLL